MEGVEKIEKIKNMYLKLPFFLKPGIITWQKKNITLDNYSNITLINKYADIWLNGESNFGYEINPYDTVFINELSRLSNEEQQQIINALTKTIRNSNSKIFISSRPNSFDPFYKLFQNAERYTQDPKKSIFKPNRIYWWQVEGRDEKWKQEEIKKIGSEEDFDREYDLQFKVQIK
jgi:hypothetical protein